MSKHVMYKSVLLGYGSQCHKLYSEKKFKELDKLLKQLDREYNELIKSVS